MRAAGPWVRVFIAAALVSGGLAAGLGSGVSRASGSETVLSLHLTGVVDPFVADYLRGSIDAAGSDGTTAVLLTIDTPGGLSSSMREITEAILASKVPVICYVAPAGARAASAGAYVLEACPIAAMAPGTNVGAATPVGITGTTETAKVTQDAAATMRSLTEANGRNADVTTRFVTDSLSISAQEALDQHVIDLIEPTQTDLLRAVAGTQVQLTNGTTVTLPALSGATIQERGLAPVVGLLHDLFDPNLAFIFFWLGLILVVIEIIVPGHIFSGTVGTILLIIAIVSFGLLPIRLLGVALLAASAVFFIVELKTPTHGALTLAGLACLVLGGLLLYNGAGGVRVSPFVLVPVAGLVGLFFGFAAVKLIAVRRMPPPRPLAETMVGRDAVVLRAGLSPRGVVRLGAEEWQALSSAGPVPAGAHVKVTSLDGLVLTVEPAVPEHDGAGAPAPAGEGGNH